MSAIVVGGADAPVYMTKRLAGMGVKNVRFCAPAEARKFLPGTDLLVVGRAERSSATVEEAVAEARALGVLVIDDTSMGRPVGFP